MCDDPMSLMSPRVGTVTSETASYQALPVSLRATLRSSRPSSPTPAPDESLGDRDRMDPPSEGRVEGRGRQGGGGEGGGEEGGGGGGDRMQDIHVCFFRKGLSRNCAPHPTIWVEPHPATMGGATPLLILAEIHTPSINAQVAIYMYVYTCTWTCTCVRAWKTEAPYHMRSYRG